MIINIQTFNMIIIRNCTT